jgi:hypothetical protein
VAHTDPRGVARIDDTIQSRTAGRGMQQVLGILIPFLNDSICTNQHREGWSERQICQRRPTAGGRWQVVLPKTVTKNNPRHGAAAVPHGRFRCPVMSDHPFAKMSALACEQTSVGRMEGEGNTVRVERSNGESESNIQGGIRAQPQA